MTLELTVLMPVVLLLLFGVVQGALILHARNVALGAAQEGVRDARVDAASAAAGEQRARRFVADAGGQEVLRDLRVVVAATTDEVRVTVTGRTLSLLPGVPGLTVSQVAVGPRERFLS